MKKNWKNRLIVSIMAINLSVLMMFYGFSLFAIKEYKSHTQLSFEKNILFISQMLSQYLDSAEKAANNVLIDQTVMELGSFGRIEEVEDNELFDLVAEFRNIVASNPLIDAVYLYTPINNQVVGNLGYFNSESYYFLRDRNEDQYYEWMEMILEGDTGFVTFDNESQNNLLLKKSLPSRGTENRGILVLEISSANIQIILDDYAVNLQGTALGIKGLIVSGDLELVSNVESSSSHGDVLILFETIERTDLEIFIYSKPSIIFSRIKTINIIATVLLIFTIVLAFGFTLLIIRQNLKPLKTIMKILGIDDRSTRNELLSIEDEVVKILKSQAISAQESKENILIRYLSSTETSLEDLSSPTNSFDINLSYTYYSVMAFADVGLDRKTIRKLLKDIESSAIETWLHYFNYHGTYFILINYEQNMEKDRVINGLMLSIKRSCGESNTSDNIEQFNYLCYQAYNCIRSLSEPENTSIIKYADLNEFYHSVSSAFLSWQENIKDGKFDDAYNKTEKILHNYLDESLYYVVFENRMSFVVTLLMNKITELDADNKELYFAELLSYSSKNEMIQVVLRIIDALREKPDHKKRTEVSVLAEGIRSIIDANFCNPDLSLTYIADIENVTTSYVSKVFKEEYDIGIVTYMNRLRIDKAMKLLGDTDSSVRSVAEQVGFNSDISFIRVFKKFMQTTPTRYRKEL